MLVRLHALFAATTTEHQECWQRPGPRFHAQFASVFCVLSPVLSLNGATTA